MFFVYNKSKLHRKTFLQNKTIMTTKKILEYFFIITTIDKCNIESFKTNNISVDNYNPYGVSMADFDKELDTSGLNCPLPIIKAKKEINSMEDGQILHVISTDPGAVKDFESFANQTGNELVSSEEKDNKFYFLLKKTK